MTTELKAAAEELGTVTMTEFKITGLGEYRTRDGRKAVVKGNDNGGSYCWKGKIGEEYYDWTEYGSYWNKGIISINDIISPWEEPATVSSVLEYKGITKKPSEVLTWLDFVQIMHTLESPKAEKQSEDEAHGNTACDEAGDAVTGSAKWAVDEVLSFCIDNAENVSVYKTGLAKELVEMLSEQGFSIVRTSTLGNRNGCYTTRTEKDVD